MAKSSKNRKASAENGGSRSQQRVVGHPPNVWQDKCWNCGCKEYPWWSRMVPMGYFCQRCGKPWTDKDGVE